MGLKTITPGSFSKYLPWKISSNEMLPNILLMNKLLFLLLCFNKFYFKIKDPFIPYISYLDVFNDYPTVFKYSLRFGFILFGLFLLFNIKTRLSSLFLGLIIIFTLLASRSLFRNHIFIIGSIFFLVGVSNNKTVLKLIILQLSIVYLGASINKMFEIDWWSGQFIHNWLYTAVKNPVYIFVSESLPTLLFAKILSWSAIIIEFIIGILILVKKWRLLGIWLIIVFHFAMFTIVHDKFGHFLQDLFIVLIAFVTWPQNKIQVKFHNNKSNHLIRLIKLLDWDSIYNWKKAESNQNNWLEVNYNKKTLTNVNGLKSLLIYSSGFYVILLGIDYLENHLLTLITVSSLKMVIHLVFCLIIWSLIIAFFPYRLKVDNRKLTFLKKSYGLI